MHHGGHRQTCLQTVLKDAPQTASPEDGPIKGYTIGQGCSAAYGGSISEDDNFEVEIDLGSELDPQEGRSPARDKLGINGSETFPERDGVALKDSRRQPAGGLIDEAFARRQKFAFASTKSPRLASQKENRQDTDLDETGLWSP